jgi:mono/diheme cytochrome c family protein
MASFSQIITAGTAIAVLVAFAAIGGQKVAPPAPVYPTPAYSLALEKRIAAAAAATGPHAPATAAAAAGITLRSVGFDLPTDGRAFPAGPGADLMAGNCTACHTPGMILTQPALTQAEWTGEVTKMIKVYKAPVADADVPGIVGYLASLKVGP